MTATLPTDGNLLLANARLPLSDTQDADIAVANGVISSITPAGTALNPSNAYDCNGGLVLPAFVDVYAHLDKGHIWPRQPNPDGSSQGALLAVKADREARWSAHDVGRRIDFALRCAYAHGAAAIRTHLDSAPPQHRITWPAFEAARDRWQGRIELQAVALIGPEQLLDQVLLDEIATTVKSAGGILGGSVGAFGRAKEAIASVVAAADRHGLDLDLHIDESQDPAARSLRLLADAVIETGYRGRVLAGHCCSLAIHGDAEARETIARVAEAGIAVVSLPMCNLYLQDRQARRTPRWRGVTLIQELQAAGVPVCLASDNTRDPFYAYGDLDALEVLRESARIAHLDHPSDAAFAWTRAIGARPARIAGFAHGAELRPGAPADLVILRARNWTELMARPQSDRIVLRRGRPIDTTPPDYRELDDLMAAR